MTDLTGKTAVVTGSTSGIGLGLARGFAQAGANVVLNGFGDTEEIEKTRTELDAAASGRVTYDGADMTKPDQIESLINSAIAQHGSVDILVNNAGIQQVAPVEDFPRDKWDMIIDINMNSAFHTARAAIPAMKSNGWGRIINIASAHGLVASPFKSAYVTAKHGVVGMSKTIALEVAEDGITCNAICPGYVLTPLVEAQIPDTARSRGMTEEEVKRDVLLAAQWTKKFVTVEQLAGVALFLCSDAAENITGIALPVDGGWTAA
ncbi:3-hydroxybutyrate dehydrogenase [Sedimentitalea arenosa]|uniref:3-hydroxybutyrate dehydrogenase n=1 Tax=Sedimentitalea arenosa TaxID=2798803 RepID=A0A8J7IV50_9RHOB|nr:3-hydroxybutyrate dehydrogenase [Arenibacterium arenosum]MBJ6373471.1 3-hydroxybutyrate dehydrogenase [Arenibacterium arenosum]